MTYEIYRDADKDRLTLRVMIDGQGRSILRAEEIEGDGYALRLWNGSDLMGSVYIRDEWE